MCLRSPPEPLLARRSTSVSECFRNDGVVNWTPLGADADTHHTLVEGVPAWMRPSLRAWIVDEYTYRSSTTHRIVNNVERMREYDLAARAIPLTVSLSSDGPAKLFNSLEDEVILRLLDWTVFNNSPRYGGQQRNASLEQILAGGSSAWKVGVRTGVAGLERRVPLGVQAAAEAGMATPGDAGRLLSEAWHAVYGQSPQPDLGYRKSIEAVEAVVLPKVMPNDDTATLGKAIGQMRAQGDWKLSVHQGAQAESVAGRGAGHDAGPMVWPQRPSSRNRFLHSFDTGGSRGSGVARGDPC